MSDAMTKAIIGMPFDLAMSDELSRMQFYRRSQSLLSDFAELEAECARMRDALEVIADNSEDRSAVDYAKGALPRVVGNK